MAAQPGGGAIGGGGGGGGSGSASGSGSGSGGGRPVGDDYVLEKQIGSGSFSVVWRGTRRSTGESVAIKEIPTERLSSKLHESLESEIAILKRARHPNIVQLLDIVKTPSRMFLVLEYCAGGDLSHHIRRSGAVREAAARHFMRQLGAGLQVLRANNLIHRDLKPQNLLLSERTPAAVLKIADFGFARSLQPQGLAETLCGSPLYMAPEILQCQRYDAKADLWSVGAILYELVVGRPPFGGQNHVHLLQNIKRSEARVPRDIATTLSDDCLGLIRALLKRNPVERLSFEQFFNHPFLGLASSPQSVRQPPASFTEPPPYPAEPPQPSPTPAEPPPQSYKSAAAATTPPPPVTTPATPPAAPVPTSAPTLPPSASPPVPAAAAAVSTPAAATVDSSGRGATRGEAYKEDSDAWGVVAVAGDGGREGGKWGGRGVGGMAGERNGGSGGNGVVERERMEEKEGYSPAPVHAQGALSTEAVAAPAEAAAAAAAAAAASAGAGFAAPANPPANPPVHTAPRSAASPVCPEPVLTQRPLLQHQGSQLPQHGQGQQQGQQQPLQHTQQPSASVVQSDRAAASAASAAAQAAIAEAPQVAVAQLTATDQDGVLAAAEAIAPPRGAVRASPLAAKLSAVAADPFLSAVSAVSAVALSPLAPSMLPLAPPPAPPAPLPPAPVLMHVAVPPKGDERGGIDSFEMLEGDYVVVQYPSESSLSAGQSSMPQAAEPSFRASQEQNELLKQRRVLESQPVKESQHLKPLPLPLPPAPASSFPAAAAAAAALSAVVGAAAAAASSATAGSSVLFSATSRLPSAAAARASPPTAAASTSSSAAAVAAAAVPSTPLIPPLDSPSVFPLPHQPHHPAPPAFVNTPSNVQSHSLQPHSLPLARIQQQHSLQSPSVQSHQVSAPAPPVKVSGFTPKMPTPFETSITSIAQVPATATPGTAAPAPSSGPQFAVSAVTAPYRTPPSPTAPYHARSGLALAVSLGAARNSGGVPVGACNTGIQKASKDAADEANEGRQLQQKELRQQQHQKERQQQQQQALLQHPQERIDCLRRSGHYIAEIAASKLEAGTPLASLSLHLVALAVWKEALTLSHEWAADSAFPGAAATAAPGASAKNSSHAMGALQEFSMAVQSGGEEAAAAAATAAAAAAVACDAVEAEFLAAVETAELVAAAVDRDDPSPVPDSLEIIFQTALIAGRSAAVEELMGNTAAAAAAYIRSATLFSFLLHHAPRLPISPPLTLSPADLQRLMKYHEGVLGRHRHCTAALDKTGF